MASLNLL